MIQLIINLSRILKKMIWKLNIVSQTDLIILEKLGYEKIFSKVST